MGRGVACGEVWEGDGEEEWMWMWSSESKVEWSSRLVLALALHLLLSLLQASLSPRTLLLAETGLDQHEASNLAHARMNEAKLCRDCFV